MSDHNSYSDQKRVRAIRPTRLRMAVFYNVMENGGLHSKRIPAGKRNGCADTEKGSPRSLSERIALTRLKGNYATSGEIQYGFIETSPSDYDGIRRILDVVKKRDKALTGQKRRFKSRPLLL